MDHAEQRPPLVLAFDDEKLPEVAYFSMEIGLSADIPTYSGGLGVLAGDALRAAADLGTRMIGITLLYHKDYVEQHLDFDGQQTEGELQWDPRDHLELLPIRATVTIEGRPVVIQAWRTMIEGVTGGLTSAVFLDTRLDENSEFDRTLTDYLYGSDAHYRFCQEVVLGIGGVAVLEKLRWHEATLHHMNEGHSSLLTLALLKRYLDEHPAASVEHGIEWVRAQCIFTTHTPVPAAFDKYDFDLVKQVLDPSYYELLDRCSCRTDGQLNLTYLALRFSRYINGVALRHGEISAGMFPGYPIHSVTNGVHATTWVSDPLAKLYDDHVPIWRLDNRYLRYATGIPLDQVQAAHRTAKQALLDEVKQRTNIGLNPDVLTIGFARRAATYKRADLLFSDMDRLRHIARDVGGLQVIYAGLAHPSDREGKDIIRRVFAAAKALSGQVAVIYLQSYNMDLAKLICAGSDLWLNTPQRPFEASGTSGMKAALNGVPSLSILDGWWVEGWFEGFTGWAIGEDTDQGGDPEREIQSLYDKLEHVIVPMFYQRPQEYANVMRHAISLNGSFFNTQRMVEQYQISAYNPAHAVLQERQAEHGFDTV